MKKTSYEISYAVITSIGERKTNEDAYGILELPDKKYFLVCDGLGLGTHKELLKNCKVYQEIAYSQLSKEELENG